MTNREFSDSFDTLLNSYASQAMFGEEAAKTEIVLDEYEKSVLLTQAQDNIIKAYFQKHTNELGQGFDDSTRRQVDFSSLIKTDELEPLTDPNLIAFDHRGIIFKMPTVNTGNKGDGNAYSRVLFILNETLVKSGGSSSSSNTKTVTLGEMEFQFINSSSKFLDVNIITVTSGSTPVHATVVNGSRYTLGVTATLSSTSIELQSGIRQAFLDANVTGISVDVSGEWGAITSNFNESFTVAAAGTSGKRNDDRFVVVPINYKEYDREMTKAYAQPLKKQAWRLFQNNTTQFDIYSEVIPIWDVDTSNLKYRVRYVERPTPIILVDLPNGLTIDGYTEEMNCTLNPILHPDVLNEAVRLAISSRASATARAEAYREQERRQQ